MDTFGVLIFLTFDALIALSIFRSFSTFGVLSFNVPAPSRVGEYSKYFQVQRMGFTYKTTHRKQGRRQDVWYSSTLDRRR
jgi:hypothetical protein